MAENDLDVEDFERVFERATGELHLFTLRPRSAFRLEVHDVHFHHNSPVMLPDCTADDDEPDGEAHAEQTGLAVLAAALRYAKEHPSQRMLIAGHADTSGNPSRNDPLSADRARSVLLVLLGDDASREEWRTKAAREDKVEDYQLVLKWIAFTRGWACDPGAVDNRLGPNTRRAIEDFQLRYNFELHPRTDRNTRAEGEIATDGVVGKETWGALYDVYQLTLRGLLRADEAGLQAHRNALAFVNDSFRAVGCGENFPIDEPERDNFRSHENRRVEILFFEPAHLPNLACHESGRCLPDECRVYNPRAFGFTPIPVTPAALDELWRLRIIVPGRGPQREWPVLANKSFVVRREQAGPDAEIRGTSNERGEIEVRVFADDDRFTLEIDGRTIQLAGGTLPPLRADDEASIKLRLWNLGYGAARPHGWSSPVYARVRRAFKKRELGADDDAIDAAMIAKLRELYGG